MRALLLLVAFIALVELGASIPFKFPRVARSAKISNLLRILSRDRAKIDQVVSAFKEKTGFITPTQPLNPVILMPGLGASGLQASLDRDTTPEWYCIKHWDCYELLVQPCWLDNMQVNYFPENNTYANQTGVSIRPNDFGGLNGVNYLDHFDDPLHITTIYATMISALQEIGYEAGVTLYGAPYDWRLPVDYMFHATDWDENMAALVEQAYKNAGNRKVWLITHSMGGPTALYFMNSMGDAWVNEFIEGFIPIAGPWSGSPDALRAVVEGTNFGLGLGSISLVNMKRIANIARQSGGVVYLLPDEFYWPEDQVFVYTPSKNYTMQDIEQLLSDLETPITEIIHQETFQLMDKMTAPIVPTYCLYGYNISTLISMQYPEDLAGHGPNYIPEPGVRDMSDLGDGTVPLQSLQECKTWISQGATQVNCKEYNLKKHSSVIKDVDVLSDVLSIVTGKSTVQGCETPVFDGMPRHK